MQSENTAKIRLSANDAVAATQPGASIAAAFGNRFAIPLDFDILTDHGPFYHMGVTDRLLSFELILTTMPMSLDLLEFDMKTWHEGYVSSIGARQWWFTRAYCITEGLHGTRAMGLGTSSLTHLHGRGGGLFEDPAPGTMGTAFGRNSEFYYNPRIRKVQVTVEGIPNQLYAQGMLPYQHWDEIVKGFACKGSSTDMTT